MLDEMGYRTRRRSGGYSAGNRKTEKEKAAELFESYIELPFKKVDAAIRKEQILIDTLESNFEELAAFSSKISELSKVIEKVKIQKRKIDSWIFSHRGELRGYDDYHRTNLIGRLLFKVKPVCGDDYYEKIRQELKENEFKSINLADRLTHLNGDLSNRQTTIEGDVTTNKDYLAKQGSISTRKRNAELRLSLLLRAKSHGQEKEISLQEREQAAASEIDKYKAYAAAYFNESRKLAESVKNEMRGQEKIVNGCPYCGSQLDETPHADHVYPITKGGLSVKENMVYVCSKCNLRKGGMTLREFITKTDLDRAFIEENLEKLGKTF